MGKSTAIDSKYDVKRFRFAVGDRPGSIHAALGLHLIKEEKVESDILLLTTFTGSLPTTILRILLFTIGTALPTWVGATKTGEGFDFASVLLTLIGPALAAFAVVYPSLLLRK